MTAKPSLAEYFAAFPGWLPTTTISLTSTGGTMTRVTMFLVFIGIVVLTALSPRFGVPGVVVVLLGPLGALVYRIAAPSFTDAAVAPEEAQLRR